MSRTIVVSFVAVALLAASHASADGEFHVVTVSQSNSGPLKSPDGACAVTVRAGEGEEWAALTLRCKGRSARQIARFYRSGEISWTPDSKYLVWLAHGVSDTQIVLFDRAGQAAPRLDQRLRDSMTARFGPLNVQVHTITLARVGSRTMDITVEQSGLAPGRRVGALAGRRAKFTVAYLPLRITER